MKPFDVPVPASLRSLYAALKVPFGVLEPIATAFLGVINMLMPFEVASPNKSKQRFQKQFQQPVFQSVPSQILSIFVFAFAPIDVPLPTSLPISQPCYDKLSSKLKNSYQSFTTHT